jgi:hypothetical protein
MHSPGPKPTITLLSTFSVEHRSAKGCRHAWQKGFADVQVGPVLSPCTEHRQSPEVALLPSMWSQRFVPPLGTLTHLCVGNCETSQYWFALQKSKPLQLHFFWPLNGPDSNSGGSFTCVMPSVPRHWGMLEQPELHSPAWQKPKIAMPSEW